MLKCFDLRDKQQARRVESNFMAPEDSLGKILNALQVSISVFNSL
jgi:hypothetical protein